MTDFHKFATAIHARFTELSKNELYAVAPAAGLPKREDGTEVSNGDALWDRYISAFPEGTNPTFRERTEHDCSSCRNFIKNIGGAVAIIGGKLESIWDVKGLEAPYDTVAAALNELVVKSPIEGLYRVSEQKYGAIFTIEALPAGETRRWNHFHGVIAAKHFSKQVGKDRGDFSTMAGVFKRGLEMSLDATDQVLELIQARVLYRGDEKKPLLTAFRKHQAAYKALKSEEEKSLYVWQNNSPQVSFFKNDVVGTLVEDLNDGMDVEAAVGRWESKMAPANYKRPTSLITPSMIKEAMKTIEEEGLSDALKRRFAKLSDVSVNNVLWVANDTKSKMKDGGIEELLMSTVKADVSKDKAIIISIDDFMQEIMPTAVSMEVLIKNSMASQFVSLTAPQHADSGQLFKWKNDFAWSYEGNIADSNIKERVKAAGGNVTTAKMRISLAWHNHDDLDLHVIEPGGTEIYFSRKQGRYGSLDVDMNAGGGTTREPVENVAFHSLVDGKYLVRVNQWALREKSNVGFTLEVENAGQVQQYTHAAGVRNSDTIQSLEITVVGGRITNIVMGKGLIGGTFSQEIWGVDTETFVKVNTVMKSPNYWDDNEVGNKHWFFMLDKCKNAEPTRGIYNEFLNSKLEKHRKVFEILGEKTKCEPTDDQLSGVGFSSTRNDSVTVRVVTDKTQRTFNVNF